MFNLASEVFIHVNSRIYTRDELYDAKFIFKDDLSISDDLASWDAGVSLSFCAGGQWGFSAGHFKFFL